MEVSVERTGKKIIFEVEGSEPDFHLVLRLKARMQIFVEDSSGGMITLEVSSSDTIASIKSKIQDEMHIPLEQQKLYFEDREVELEDNCTLSGYNIKKNSTLWLVEESSHRMKIFIKTMTGKTITCMVKSSTTIGSLEAKLEKMEGIPPAQQLLIFGGRRLRNDLTVGDYNIQNESTIDLLLNQTGS